MRIKKEFVLDLSFLALDFIIMADAILNPFEIQKTESKSQTKSKAKTENIKANNKVNIINKDF